MKNERHDGTRPRLSPEEYAKKRLERNLKLVEEPDAVVVIPFSKPKRNALLYMVISLDRISANITRRLGFGLELSDARNRFDEIEDFVDRLWDEMKSLAPYLHDRRKEEWRKLNDPVEMRRMLAQRRASFVLVPRSEHAGQAAIAVKIIENSNLTIRQTGSFDELASVTKQYLKICEEFDKFLGSLTEKCNLEYDSPYKDITKVKENEADNETDGKKKTKT